MMREEARDLLIERVRLGKVHKADGAAADLVFVSRTDAALGRADLDRIVGGALAMRIELAMDGEDQRDIVGDLQIVRRDGDALRFDFLDLLDEMMRIEDD